MKPWNSAYRINVKRIEDFLKENQYNFVLEGYSKEYIGCSFVIKLDNKKMEITCGTTYLTDNKSRPYYIIRYNNISYNVVYLKQIFNLFNKFKESNVQFALNYLAKETKQIEKQAKITEDF
jgi:hypothetical protein